MPDFWMDVDTALSEVPVNIMPLLDDTDFKTIEDAVAYNAAGMALFWHFVTSAGAYTVTAVTPTTAGDYDWTDQGTAGIYTIEIPASGGASINNDTEGYGWFTGKATGVLPWRGPTIGLRAAAINDSMCDTNTTGLLAPTVAGRTLDVSAGGEAGVDWANVGTPGSTVGLTATTVATVTTATTATNVTTVNGLAANVITATSIAADAITAAKIATGAIDADALATDAVAEIADGVWDEPIAGHLTAGTEGIYVAVGGGILIDTTITGVPTSTSWTFSGGVASANFYKDQIVYILSGTGIGQARPILSSSEAAGTTTLTFDEAFIVTPAAADRFCITSAHIHPISQIADVIWDEDATAHQTQGTFGQAIGDPAADTNTIYKAVVTDATGATVGVDVAAVLDDTGTAGVVVAAGSKTGYSLTATTGLGNQTANITGNLSGSVGSVTGAVGSVTGAVGSVTGAVGSVTGNVGGNVVGSVGSLGTTAKSDVNAEVVDALNVDTYAEPGQESPGATASLVKKIGYLYKAWRNRTKQTASQYSLYNDDAATVDQKATFSDDGTTADKGEISTGP